MRASSKALRRLAAAGVAMAVFAMLTCCNGGAHTEAATNADATADSSTMAAANDELGDDYWLGSCLAPQASEYGPSFTEASLTESELSLYGTARVGASEDEAASGDSDWTEARQWSFAVTDETVFEGRNPVGSNTSFSFDDAKELIESLNGIGIELHVQDGVVTYVCFMS